MASACAISGKRWASARTRQRCGSITRYSVPEQTFGLAGWTDVILNTSKDKLVASAVIFVTIGVSIGVLLRSKPSEAEVGTQLARESTRGSGTVEGANPIGQRVRSAVGAVDAEAPRAVRQIIHVVDEEDQPVAGVAIRAQRSDEYRFGEANTDFQFAIVTTDAEGLWTYPYVPKGYEELRLVLTHDEYAVTLPNIPIDQVDPQNLVLVIDRGFIVAARLPIHKTGRSRARL
jgi:hypothetical protein